MENYRKRALIYAYTFNKKKGMELKSYSVAYRTAHDGEKQYVRRIVLDYPILTSTLGYTNDKSQALELPAEDYRWWIEKLPDQFDGHVIETTSYFTK